MYRMFFNRMKVSIRPCKRKEGGRQHYFVVVGTPRIWSKAMRMIQAFSVAV